MFGATGRVGDGILEAALNDQAVRQIQVITRRASARIDEGTAAGKVTVTKHLDYLDYSAIRPILASVDVIYWALGTSTMNVSDEEYSAIHVDYPARLVREWLAVRGPESVLSFHLVSGMGAGSDAWSHWAREKARAEQVLFDMARGTGLRVISYRPGGVIPSGVHVRFYDALRRALFVPTKLGIDSPAIGRAMLEVTMRGPEFASGTILENRALLRYSNGYLRSVSQTS